MTDEGDRWRIEACPMCMEDVHELATACPSCGATRRGPGRPFISYRKGRQNDIMLAAVGLFAIWIVLAIVIAFLGAIASVP